MDLTLIICTYKRGKSIDQTLNALQGQLPSSTKWQLLIVDNADDIETHQVAKKYQDTLPVELIIEKKPGQNSARNAAIPHIKGELVVFTDDDITPQENWLQSLLTAAQHHPEVDVFGGRIIPVWPDNGTPWQANAWFSNFVYADQDLGNEDLEYKEGCYPSSPNMAIRKKIFDQGITFNDKIGPIGKNRISGSESEFLSRVLEDRKGLYIADSKVLHRITTNMMTRKYLRKRCYTMGLGMSVWNASPSNERNLPRIFGVPRYRIGRIATESLKAFWYQLTFNNTKASEAECAALLDLGFCIGIWKNLKSSI